MKKRLFKFSWGNEGGIFDFDITKYSDVMDDYHALACLYVTEDVTPKEYIACLGVLIERKPDFLYAYAQRAIAHLDMGNHNDAFRDAWQAIIIAEQVIPMGYKGLIQWGYPDNRPYLLSLQVAGIAAHEFGHHNRAKYYLKKLLAYNPTDNQGIKQLMDEYQYS